jgi:DNA-binding MarR family transcriptional regulator
MRIPEVGEGKRGPEGHLLYLLRQTATLVAREVERMLAPLDLSLAFYSALTMIAAYEDISSAELSRLSMLSAQSGNETVQKLVTAGLIRRRRDPRHGRVLRLRITAAGRKRLARGRKLTDSLEECLLAKAREVDAKAVREWLAGVARALSSSEASEAANQAPPHRHQSAARPFP